ncbi:hypothetical protein [Nesterenkonia marinintestina]|uniref:hypothetical protein n=1 Tax=Nesterenkonia marinintestina TaxID=2979865 RepID=UPI0021BEDDB4|nr:hypothetical protein [Nesterenkonia sp. GX14115]
MEPIFAAVVILAFIALGELVSIWSRARVPGLLVAMLGAFIFAQLGIIPETAVDDSLLPQVYTILVVPLLFHMGSLIPLRTLLQQWRAVVIALSGITFALVTLALVLIPLYGFDHFVAAGGPLTGGIVATGLTTDGLEAADVMPALVVLPALILMMQSLPAMPISSFLLRRYSKHLVDSGELQKYSQTAARTSSADDDGRKLINMPKYLVDNHIFVLFLVLIGASLATLVEILTQAPATVVALLLGIVSTAIGFTPERSLEQANSFGIAIVGVVAIIMAPLMTASLQDVFAMIVPMTIIILVGAAGIIVGGFVATKLVGWRPTLGMSVALTAMYGFPADYLIPREVARSVGESEEQRDEIFNSMLPPMLVGGFTSVSAGSVLIAGILVSFL